MTASAGNLPGRIFMSYRRKDTDYPAAWLYDRLVRHFTGGEVFKDVNSIELGDDFVEAITTAVAGCDVLLALIGDRWLAIAGEDGRRRLDDPGDFVRLEIEAALARNVRVIPVLVGGARMPRAEDLPAGLADLVRRQALELSPNRFDLDTRRLLKVLDRTITEAQEQARKETGRVARHRQKAERRQAHRGERAAASDQTGLAPPPQPEPSAVMVTRSGPAPGPPVSARPGPQRDQGLSPEPRRSSGEVIFELRIGAGEEPGTFRVEVLRSEGGGTPEGRLVLNADNILSRRGELENAVLASAVQGRGGRVPTAEAPLREVGQQLFEALFRERIYRAYRASLGAAQKDQRQLQVLLQVTTPELAGLPWEALYDPETEAYLCLNEPLIRCVETPYTSKPLRVKPPLHILGLVASPSGLPLLDVEAEKQRLETALAIPLAEGRVNLTWAQNASWGAIHDLMLTGTWNILHFIGHGDFDVSADEGYLMLVGQDGRADRVEASRLANLLCVAKPVPRLVVLNSCSSGENGSSDLFSGTAAMLVRRGVSAVAAMQFRISDPAAINFARGFYAAIAAGRPVDEAMRSGRVGIRGLEWITPVLYVRAGLTHLFALPKQTVTTPASSGSKTPTESPARAGPPSSDLDQEPGVNSVKAAAQSDSVAAAGGQPTPARLRWRGWPALVRGRSRAWIAVATAVAAIAVAGVITLHHFPSGSRSAWPYQTDPTGYAAVDAQPLIANGVVYVGSTSGRVYALNANTGTALWQFPSSGNRAIGSVNSGPEVAGNIVYFGSDNGRIYAVNDATGHQIWSRPCYKPGDPVRSTPLLMDGIVYATSGTGHVCAMRAASGTPLWNPVGIGYGASGSSPIAPPVPGALDRTLIYVGSGNGHVYALNAGTGRKQWEYPYKNQPGVGVIDSQPVMSTNGSTGSTIYVASSGNGGRLYALAAGTGNLYWEYPAKNQTGIGPIDSQLAVANDGSAVYFASGLHVYALNVSSGKPERSWPGSWTVSLPSYADGPVLGPPHSDAMYVAGGDHVYCLNASSGDRCWQPPFTADSRVESPLAVNINNNNIYFGTDDGKVYALWDTGELFHLHH